MSRNNSFFPAWYGGWTCYYKKKKKEKKRKKGWALYGDYFLVQLVGGYVLSTVLNCESCDLQLQSLWKYDVNVNVGIWVATSQYRKEISGRVYVICIFLNLINRYSQGSQMDGSTI